jgi:hypothetical protein
MKAMKKIMAALFLSYLLPFNLLAQGYYPFEGVWIMDKQASNFGGLTAPVEGWASLNVQDFGIIYMYAESSRGLRTLNSSIFNPDGKTYEIEGAPQWDSICLKAADKLYSDLEAEYSKNGQPITKRRFKVVGNTLTITTIIYPTDTQGEINVAIVYRRRE